MHENVEIRHTCYCVGMSTGYQKRMQSHGCARGTSSLQMHYYFSVTIRSDIKNIIHGGKERRGPVSAAVISFYGYAKVATHPM